MKKHINKILIGVAAGLILFSAMMTKAQTLEQLRKENQELKETLRIIKENNALKAQIEVLKKGKVLPKPAPAQVVVIVPPTEPEGKAARLDEPIAVKPAAVVPLKAPDGVPAPAGDEPEPAPDPGSGSATTGKCFDTSSLPELDRNICNLADAAIRGNKNRLVGRMGDIKGYLGAIFEEKSVPAAARSPKKVDDPEAVKRASEKSFVLDSERIRTDKQIGSNPNSSGTTALTVRGGGPAIIGWAIENGAATSSVNGNTVTVRVNPYNLGRALFIGQTLPEIRSLAGTALAKSISSSDPQKENRGFDMRKLYFGFSFDTTRGTETPTLIASKQQLSAWSVRYEFINRRNPLDPIYKDAREAYFLSQKATGDKIVDTVKAIFSDPKFKPAVDVWIAAVDEALKANDGECAKKLNNLSEARTRCVEKAYAVIQSKVDSFPYAELMKNKEVADLFATLDEGTGAYKKRRQDFLDKVNRGAIATFEYTNNREVNSPDTSNFRFIWEKGFYRNVDFTLNADFTMFNKKPAAMNIKRIRDFNFALQFDRPMNDILPFGNTVLSGAFRYTRQQGDVVLPNGVVASGTKGDIAFGQLKLTIPFGDTGIKIPFSVTFGNRNEFVKENFVRGNFGITFDLDQIFRPLNIFR